MNYEKTAEPTDLCSDMGAKSSQKSRVKHQFYPSIIGFILRRASAWVIFCGLIGTIVS